METVNIKINGKDYAVEKGITVLEAARYAGIDIPTLCYLKDINERTHIEKREGGAAYTEDDGATWTKLSMDATVSMNMWGFSASILKELKERFPLFLKENVESNPLKCEYFLPFVVDELLGEKKATVKVLKSMDKWYGVTYKEDKPVVVAAIQKLKDDGLYPQKLWED